MTNQFHISKIHPCAEIYWKPRVIWPLVRKKVEKSSVSSNFSERRKHDRIIDKERSSAHGRRLIFLVIYDPLNKNFKWLLTSLWDISNNTLINIPWNLEYCRVAKEQRNCSIQRLKFTEIILFIFMFTVLMVLVIVKCA